MECSEPVIKILNYASGGVKDLQLPDAVLMTLTGDGSAGGGVGALEFEGVDSVMETVYFSYSKGKTKQYVSLNLKSIKWELKEDLPENDLFEDIRLMSKLCNYNYTHSQSTGFNKISCREETLPGDGFKYYLSEGKFIKESVDDNSRTILQPVLMTQKYSPFGWTEEGVVRELVYDGGSFWLGTNLGISGYNPKEETWKLIGTDEGLVSREVSGFVVSEDKIWVTTRWGGLSRININ